MNTAKRNLYIFAFWRHHRGMSGGDNIYEQFTKRKPSNWRVTIFTNTDFFAKYGYVVDYVMRTYFAIKKALRIKLLKGDVIYSASDFYPDTFPAFILKWQYPKNKWVAGFYLFPPPCRLIHWLTQKLSYFLVNGWADVVFVTSVPDQKYFRHSFVVRGGVELDVIEQYKKQYEKQWDAIFIGRLHPQKGILELMSMWREVNKVLPKANLCVVGNGPLLRQAKRLAPSTVDFLGYLEGREKYRMIQSSKIILHPAIWDSGGMSCAEGMAYGLPAVGFNLPAYKTYYAEGIVKCNSKAHFAETIIKLLTDKGLYKIMGEGARSYIYRVWDWDKKAKEIWDILSV